MVVFLVAIFAYKGEAGTDIGVGTIYGQPFMASSLSYGVGRHSYTAGGCCLKKRSSGHMHVDKSLATPFSFCYHTLPTDAGAGVYRECYRQLCIRCYFPGCFCLLHMDNVQKKECRADRRCRGPLFLPNRTQGYQREDGSGCSAAAGRSGAVVHRLRKMVGTVEALSEGIGLSALALALIIVPAATAIPETSTALIWGFKGRDTLSLGSLVARKSSIRPSIQPWRFYSSHVLRYPHPHERYSYYDNLADALSVYPF